MCGGMKVTVSSLSNSFQVPTKWKPVSDIIGPPSQARPGPRAGLHHARSSGAGLGNMGSGERGEREDWDTGSKPTGNREYDHRTPGKIGQYSIEWDSWIMSWIHSTFLYKSRVLPDMTLSRNLRPNLMVSQARMLMIRVFVKHQSRFRKLNFPFCSPSLF